MYRASFQAVKIYPVIRLGKINIRTTHLCVSYIKALILRLRSQLTICYMEGYEY